MSCEVFWSHDPRCECLENFLGRELSTALYLAERLCLSPPSLLREGFSSLVKIASLTPLSKHLSSLTNTFTLLSSKECPVSFGWRWNRQVLTWGGGSPVLSTSRLQHRRARRVSCVEHFNNFNNFNKETFEQSVLQPLNKTTQIITCTNVPSNVPISVSCGACCTGCTHWGNLLYQQTVVVNYFISQWDSSTHPL